MPWYEPYWVLIKEWKLGIHLLFNTEYFGVNNKWKEQHSSIIHSNPSTLSFIQRYKWMRARCFIGFVPVEYARAWFPIYYFKHYRGRYKFK